MSLRVAARRLALPGAARSPAPAPAGSSLPPAQRRNKWSIVNPFWRKSPTGSNASAGSGETGGVGGQLDDPKKREEFMQHTQFGGAQNSIFQDEIDSVTDKPAADAPTGPQAAVKTRENTALVVNPDPRGRLRWQRKKVIQMLRKNGELTKEERIKMTERELLHKSHFLPTSVKKLVMLSRQIAGKPLDDAIAQMKWSKKKMGREILYYLEEARDLAIAHRGMGLGRVNGETLSTPVKIQTKEGKWIEISDPTSMYVAQSWVGRGEWRGKEIDFKGRGRSGIIQHPSTSVTILLKEEKTRIREYEERKARKLAQGPWVHLPDRRIYHQRPYYSW